MNQKTLLNRKSMLLGGVLYAVFVGILWGQVNSRIGYWQWLPRFVSNSYILTLVNIGISTVISFALYMIFAIWMPCKILKIKVDWERAAIAVVCVYALQLFLSGSFVFFNTIFGGQMFSIVRFLNLPFLFMYAALANSFSLNAKQSRVSVLISGCIFVLGLIGNGVIILAEPTYISQTIRTSYPKILLMFCACLIYVSRKVKLSDKVTKSTWVALGSLCLVLCICPMNSHRVYNNKLVDIQQTYNKDGSVRYNKDGSKKLKRVYEHTETQVYGLSAGSTVFLFIVELVGVWYACVAIREIPKLEKSLSAQIRKDND